MKKCILLSIAALLCFAALAGCVKVEKKISVSKAQKIVVYDAAGNEKAVLTEQADIDAFVDTISADGWEFSQLPEGLTEAGSFTLWQEQPIIALFGERESKINQICTFRVYESDGGGYLTIETGVMDIHLSIPQETADYLRELAA